MGLRINEKIKLKNNVTANISKSGVGYSWKPRPGYTYTLTVHGTIRETYYIPGKGVSYVDEYKVKKKKRKKIEKRLREMGGIG